MPRPDVASPHAPAHRRTFPRHRRRLTDRAGAGAFPRTAVDAGTGDGRYPLHVARTRADTLAIGLDASSDALAYAARRAARERLPNLVLLRKPIESLPLESLADEVTVDGRAPLLVDDLARATRAYHVRGFTLIERRAVVRADVHAARSSWGKRLGVGAA